jgi:hypothetical protein
MALRALTPFLLLFSALTIQPCASALTVYYQIGQHVMATGTGTADAANYTGSAAYNPTVLQPPAPPGASAMPTAFGIALSPQVLPGASIMQTGLFFGFSIEMLFINQVCEYSLSCRGPFFAHIIDLVYSRNERVRHFPFAIKKSIAKASRSNPLPPILRPRNAAMRLRPHCKLSGRPGRHRYRHGHHNSLELHRLRRV